MKTKKREEALRLRLELQLSYGELRKRLGVSKSTLSYWLREHPLSEDRILLLRRKGWKKGEVSRERYRNTMRRKADTHDAQVYEKETEKLVCLKDDSLYVAGLMLYAAEGSKKERYKIMFANTDSRMIRFFVAWLQKFFGISKADVRFQLHLYKDMDIKKETTFWERELGAGKEQFYKTQIRTLAKSSFSYRESFRHSTCSVYVGSKEHKTRIMQGIKAFFDLHTA